MPSLLMLPFIQCHQTSGRALCGGFRKPAFSASSGACAEFAALCARFDWPERVSRTMPTAIFPIIEGGIVLSFIVICNSSAETFSGASFAKTRIYIRAIVMFHRGSGSVGKNNYGDSDSSSQNDAAEGPTYPTTFHRDALTIGIHAL